jgi:hypothetical protein
VGETPARAGALSGEALSRWVTVVAALLPFAIALTYVLGRIYADAYFSAIGVDADFINPNTTTFLLSGAEWQFGSVGLMLGFFLLLFLLVFCIVLAVLVVSFLLGGLSHCVMRLFKRPSDFRRSVAGVFAFFAPQEAGKPKEEQQSLMDLWRENKVQNVVGFVAIALLSSMTVHDYARAKAKSDVQSWTALTDDALDRFSISTQRDERTYYGKIVACGEDACAIWTRNALVHAPRSGISLLETSAAEVKRRISAISDGSR